MSLTVVASGVALTATAASAAPGDITQITSATLAPSAAAGATPSRLVRLPKTDSFLALGRDASTAGSHHFLWKVKSDLSIDATFGAIDLGDDFAYPTSAQTSCGNQCQNSTGTLVVSEKLDKYAVSYTRSLKGTASSDVMVFSFAVGSLSTGAVTSRSMFLSVVSSNSGATAADYAAYSTNEIGKDQCTAATGATKNSVPLTYAFRNTTLQFRPDGSLFFGLMCQYDNYGQNLGNSQSESYSSSILVGLKSSGSSLVVDTSFGTNGRVVTFDPTTTCGMLGPGVNTVDASVSSVTSTSPYFFVINNEYARPNTGGCMGGMNTVYTNKITPYTANGTALTTQTLSTGDMTYVGRWVIDPLGRWNGVMSSMGMTPSFSAIRLANGVLDTTLGANGLKSLSTLPSSITVGGTSVRMSYSISGVVNAGNTVYFTGLASASSGTRIYTCPSTAALTQTYYPYLLSFDTGLLTTYGTSGLGTAGSLSVSDNPNCDTSVAGTSYVDTTGRIGYVTSVAALGSQTAGYVGMKWDAAQGVTSGGDGDVGVAQATTPVVPVATKRVDKKVYSTKLPTAAQPDSALTVLTAKQAKTLDIRSTTPKICVALTTSVLLVNPGRCVVQIIDEDTKKVLRSMTTTVKKDDVEVGTTLTTDEPIMFKQAITKLSKKALAQVAELAEAAKNARRVVVIGHSAAIGEISQYSYAISRNRANAVKAALVKAGVKATIEVVALSYSQPEATKKTEAAQAKNRRAEVFIFP
jgi:outer membrane protein OmpA-like peptidoglycan-associated protein